MTRSGWMLPPLFPGTAVSPGAGCQGCAAATATGDPSGRGRGVGDGFTSRRFTDGWWSSYKPTITWAPSYLEITTDLSIFQQQLIDHPVKHHQRSNRMPGMERTLEAAFESDTGSAPRW